jgi:hypothetical protein
LAPTGEPDATLRQFFRKAEITISAPECLNEVTATVIFGVGRDRLKNS